VFIGTTVAIGVNVFRLPREKQPDKVFFIRTKDLVPDRFSQISPAAMYRLNYLYDDGAKICLMSEHAPAFFILQMSATKLNVPLIVMDGAAIYDYGENRFLQAEYIEPELIIGIMERLQALNLSCFIYTIHNNRTCIFHQGEIRQPEKTVLERMKRSPYRDYLDGDIHSPEEIVYFKIIDEDGKLAEIESRLSRVLPKGKLRAVIRKQAGAPGISGLYIYAHTATMEQAEKRLMQMLREEDPGLTPVNVRLKSPYSSERDAMHILYTVGRSYEPVRLFRKRRKR
jgi:hydroxymethylpyrimidine pyrophosphatase-like HAD family hydrolase